MEIPQSIVDRITNNRWRTFAKSIEVGLGILKEDCIKNINTAITNDNNPKNALLEFIADELSRGKNRYMQISKFSTAKKLIFQEKSYIADILKNKFNCLPNENKLLETKNPLSINDTNEPILVYSKVTKKKSNTTLDLIEKIDLCFKEYYAVGGFTYKGVKIPVTIETDFIWCEIDVNKNNVKIKTKDESTSNHKTRNATTICAKYQKLIFEVFNLGEMESVAEINNTLYKIFKDFTDTAEKEFIDKVAPYLKDISTFTDTLSDKLKIQSSVYPLDIPLRVQRLFERSLIQQDFEKYTSFFTGKKGVVTRLFFSDESGATVNARSGDQSKEGIAVADIYFDTRETIDELKALETIWVTWFVQNEDTLITNCKTRIFVLNDSYVVHFLYGYVLEEEENYVFSNIERYRTEI